MAEDQPEVEVVEPERKTGRAPKVPLSMDQQREIVHLYTETDTPLLDIEQRFGISNQRMYQVFHKQGLDWRRNDSISFQAYLERQTAPPVPHTNGVVQPTEIVDSVPEDINKALENMIVRPVVEVRPETLRSTPPPTRHVEPRQIEPVRRSSPDLPSYVNEILPEGDGYQNWEVSYVGKMLVRARSAREALDSAERDGHITQIVGVTLRPR